MILSIDCGSTNHKAAVFDPALKRLAASSVPVNYTFNEAGRVEFSAAQIWEETVGQIRRVCQMANVDPSGITSIALTSQAQTFTIVDERERAANFISWRDRRACRESADLKEQFGMNFHRHCSFPEPCAELQLSKLFWLSRHQASDLSPRSRIFSLPGYLAWRLGGLQVTDTNLAAMSGLYSCQEGRWWEPALKTAGIHGDQLGETGPVGHAMTVRGPCPEINLAANLRIVFAGNDQTAGACANGVDVHPVILTLGTALVAYRYAGLRAGPYHPKGCWGPYPGGGFYELAARNHCCGALYQAVNKMTGDLFRFVELAETAGPGAALFLPRAAPGKTAWMGAADPGARARAVLEGICFSARQLLESDLELRLGEFPIPVTGGGSDCLVWLEILSNILNCPIRRGGGDALLGAATMAAETRNNLRAGGPGEVIEPDPGAVAQYEQIYHHWLEFENSFHREESHALSL